MQRDTRRALLIVVLVFVPSILAFIVSQMIWGGPYSGPEMPPYEVEFLDGWSNDDPNCDIRFPFESNASMTLELTPPSMPAEVPEVYLVARRPPDRAQHMLPNDSKHVRLQAAGKMRVEVFVQQLYMRCERGPYGERDSTDSRPEKQCYEEPIREETWELGILIKYPGAHIVLNNLLEPPDKGSRAYSLRVCNVRGEPSPAEAESPLPEPPTSR